MRLPHRPAQQVRAADELAVCVVGELEHEIGPRHIGHRHRMPVNNSCSTISRWLELRPHETGLEPTAPPRATPGGVRPDSPDMSASSPRVQVNLTLWSSPEAVPAIPAGPAGSSGWRGGGLDVHPAEDGMGRLVHPPEGRTGRRFIQPRVTWMEET